MGMSWAKLLLIVGLAFSVGEAGAAESLEAFGQKLSKMLRQEKGAGIAVAVVKADLVVCYRMDYAQPL